MAAHASGRFRLSANVSFSYYSCSQLRLLTWPNRHCNQARSLIVPKTTALKTRNLGPIAVSEGLYLKVLQAAEIESGGNISKYIRDSLLLKDLLEKNLLTPEEVVEIYLGD